MKLDIVSLPMLMIDLDELCPRLVPNPRITQKDLSEVSHLIRDCKLSYLGLL